MRELNYTNVSKYIIDWLDSYAKDSSVKGFTIGVSGGIDSGVVSTLLAMTGLPVLILDMPIHQKQDEVTRAQNHITWLKSKYTNVSSSKVDLTDAYDTLYETFAPNSGLISKEDFDFSMGNTRSRLRMTTLYQFAGMYKYLVAGTGNKVEDLGIGYFSKYGDGGVDLSPIGDLMKSEVYSLGAELGLLDEILTAIPTDGLHDDGRTDESDIGCKYSELEDIMINVIGDSDIMDSEVYHKLEKTLVGRQLEVFKIYAKYHISNKHKMLPIPVCLLS